MPSVEFTSIRIDVPLVSTVLYFFVNESDSSWDPWWGRLYSYLASYAAPEMVWHLEPIQNVVWAERGLTQEETSELLSVLKAAPQKEIDGHATLEKSIRLLVDRDRPASLMFFRDRVATPSAAKE